MCLKRNILLTLHTEGHL